MEGSFPPHTPELLSSLLPTPWQTCQEEIFAAHTMAAHGRCPKCLDWGGMGIGRGVSVAPVHTQGRTYGYHSLPPDTQSCLLRLGGKISYAG